MVLNYIFASFLMLPVLMIYQDGTCLAATTSYWKLALKMETCQNRSVVKMCPLGTTVNSLFFIGLCHLMCFFLLISDCYSCTAVYSLCNPLAASKNYWKQFHKGMPCSSYISKYLYIPAVSSSGNCEMELRLRIFFYTDTCLNLLF